MVRLYNTVSAVIIAQYTFKFSKHSSYGHWQICATCVTYVTSGRDTYQLCISSEIPHSIIFYLGNMVQLSIIFYLGNMVFQAKLQSFPRICVSATCAISGTKLSMSITQLEKGRILWLLTSRVMVVNSKYTVKIHIFAIHLLISGAQYLIGTLKYV